MLQIAIEFVFHNDSLQCFFLLLQKPNLFSALRAKTTTILTKNNLVFIHFLEISSPQANIFEVSHLFFVISFVFLNTFGVFFMKYFTPWLKALG